ncbi:MAG: hypothetical protein ACRELG_10605 [Gemmataceae bacterium]
MAKGTNIATATGCSWPMASSGNSSTAFSLADLRADNAPCLAASATSASPTTNHYYLTALAGQEKARKAEKRTSASALVFRPIPFSTEPKLP